MSIWEIFKKHAKGLNGRAFETSLLGKVGYVKNAFGGFVSVIPAALRRAANENGFDILSADWRNGTYLLCATTTPGATES